MWDTLNVWAPFTKESNLAKLFGEILSLPEAQRPNCKWCEQILTKGNNFRTKTTAQSVFFAQSHLVCFGNSYHTTASIALSAKLGKSWRTQIFCSLSEPIFSKTISLTPFFLTNCPSETTGNGCWSGRTQLYRRDIVVLQARFYTDFRLLNVFDPKGLLQLLFPKKGHVSYSKCWTVRKKNTFAEYCRCELKALFCHFFIAFIASQGTSLRCFSVWWRAALQKLLPHWPWAMWTWLWRRSTMRLMLRRATGCGPRSAFPGLMPEIISCQNVISMWIRCFHWFRSFFLHFLLKTLNRRSFFLFTFHIYGFASRRSEISCWRLPGEPLPLGELVFKLQS